MSQVTMSWAVADTAVETYDTMTVQAQWGARGGNSYDYQLPPFTAQEQAELQQWGAENERLARMLSDDQIRAGLADAAQRRLNNLR